MYTYAAKVDIGVFEKENDDRAMIDSLIIRDETVSGRIEKEQVTACICDGVGGLAKGYLASEITLGVFGNLSGSEIGKYEIQDAVTEANRQVLSAQETENCRHGMRCTLAGVYVDGQKFFVYNVGDSRVYLFQYRYLLQLSKDHSVVQELVDFGMINEDEARKHPQRNIITKCIGNEVSVRARIIDKSGELCMGDILFLCSDGVSDVLCDAEVQDVISKHKNDVELTVCCQELYDLAVMRGSKDNISIILMRKD